jgi:hypothetical protein
MAFGMLSGKFLTGESVPEELTYFLNLQDTIAPSVPKQGQRLYQEIALKKMVNFNRVVLAFIEQQSL